MGMNWLQNLIFGLLSGVSSLLPVSASGHQSLFLILTGIDGDLHLFRIAAALGTMACLLFTCRPILHRFRREQRIAAVPAKRRRRQPDPITLRQIRLVRVAAIPLLLAAAGAWLLGLGELPLWAVAAAVLFNGVLLYVPQFVRQGNKNAASMSYLDGLLMGLGGILAFLPGCSGVAGTLSVGSLCGSSRENALDMAFLLSIVTMLLLIAITVLQIVMAGGIVFSFVILLQCILTALGAALGAWLGVLLMRFLAVNIGFSGFAYYCWGLALMMFILYLSI